MRNNATKILGFFSTIFGLYAVITTLVIVFGLDSSPQQIFKSAKVQADIKELNLDTLQKDFENIETIKHILTYPKEGKPTLYVRNSEYFKPSLTEASFQEKLLQLSSGSGEIYAGNCPSQRYIHGTECTGPHYFNDGTVIPVTCNCIRN